METEKCKAVIELFIVIDRLDFEITYQTLIPKNLSAVSNFPTIQHTFNVTLL